MTDAVDDRSSCEVQYRSVSEIRLVAFPYLLLRWNQVALMGTGFPVSLLPARSEVAEGMRSYLNGSCCCSLCGRCHFQPDNLAEM